MIADNHDRELPQDIQAEQSVLGAMLLDPNMAEQMIEELGERNYFYRVDHEIIFRAIEALYTSGEPADPVTVGAYLTKKGDIARVGGAPYLQLLFHSVPTVANGPYYADIVKERAVLRRLVEAGTRIVQMGYQTDGSDLPAIVARAEQEMEAVVESAFTGSKANTEERFPTLDWETAYAKDRSKVAWLPGRFMARGQQVVLVGGGKVGKSMVAQDWAYHCVTARAFLGDEPHEPLKVLYFDKENTEDDIVGRMVSFGAKPEELKNLVYKSFPKFSGTLDGSSMAAAELLAIVDDEKPDIVVIDTVSRFIEGKENDSSPWLELYRRIHEPLKAQGIACVRLDHFGKDEEKGARGNSAKSQDVDHVWELKLVATRPVAWDPETDIEIVSKDLKMIRTHTRSGLGRDAFQITRHGRRYRDGDEGWFAGCTCHVLKNDAAPTTTAPQKDTDDEITRGVLMLIEANLPNNWGRNRVKAFITERGLDIHVRDATLGKMITGVKNHRAAERCPK